MNDYDRSSRLLIANEDLEQLSFKITNAKKIAKRVSNDIDSPLFVTSVDTPSEEDVLVFDEAPAILKEVLTTVVNYIVPPTKVFYLDKIVGTGENIAKYSVKIDGVVRKVKRSYYGASLNVNFVYNSYKVNSGSEIILEVIHNQDFIADFEGYIEGRLYNE
jgi:hypothetical protein